MTSIESTLKMPNGLTMNYVVLRKDRPEAARMAPLENDRELKVFNSLELIVELGRSGSSPVDVVLPRAHSYGLFWGRWNELLSFWDLVKLELLIKGFVKLEALSSSNKFGSVSPVPQIFTLYCTKVDQVQIDTLANWVLVNTVNDYSPYGSHNHGAKSLIELSMLEQQRKEIKRKRQDQEFTREKKQNLTEQKLLLYDCQTLF